MTRIKVILFSLLLIFNFSCKDYKQIDETPLKYKYKVDGITFQTYSRDTAMVHATLVKMLHEHTNPFDQQAYDDDTDLFVDSLVYGPDRLRMIVLVIVKNETVKLLKRENDSTFYYDAYYLFCERKSPQNSIHVYDYSGDRLSRFYDYEKISAALREYCFTRLRNDEGDEPHFNVDDKRFWDSQTFKWVLENSKATRELN